MSTKILYSTDDSVEELFLPFIDDEHNKDIEIKFAQYLNECFKYKDKSDSLSGESGNNDEAIAN